MNLAAELRDATAHAAVALQGDAWTHSDVRGDNLLVENVDFSLPPGGISGYCAVKKCATSADCGSAARARPMCPVPTSIHCLIASRSVPERDRR